MKLVFALLLATLALAVAIPVERNKGVYCSGDYCLGYCCNEGRDCCLYPKIPAASFDQHKNHITTGREHEERKFPITPGSGLDERLNAITPSSGDFIERKHPIKPVPDHRERLNPITPGSGDFAEEPTYAPTRKCLSCMPCGLTGTPCNIYNATNCCRGASHCSFDYDDGSGICIF